MGKQKPLQTLYYSLRDNNYDVPDSYESFERTLTAPGMEGVKNRQQLHKALVENNYDVPEDYSRFSKTLFQPVKSSGGAAAQPTGGYKPSAEEMAGFQGIIGSARRTAGRATQDYERKAKLMEKRQGLNVPGRVELGQSNNLTPTEQHFNPETGELEQGYMTESGNEYENKAIADMEQRELERQRWEREHPEESLMSQIDDRIANLEEEIRKREDIEGIPAGFGTTLYQSGLGAPYRPDAQQQSYDNMRMALRDLQDAKVMLERNRQLHASSDFLGGVGIPFTKDWYNNWKNFGYGVWDALHDVSMYDFGVSEMSKAGTYMRIKNKIERGEELTDQETDIALAGMALAQAQQLADLPHGYTAGVTTTEMVPFMAQMAANPASGVGKAFARKAVRKFGRDGLKAVTARVAARVAGNVGEAAVLSNTWQAGKTAADIALRNTGGQFAYDENENIIMGHYERGDNGEEYFVEGGKGIGQSIYEGEAASIIENFTELGFGGSINGMLSRAAGSRLGNKIGLGYISDLVGKVGTTPFARSMKHFMERTHWDGMIEEPLEEEYGIILNSLLTGDNQFSDLIDSKQQADIFAGTMWFGGMMAAMNTAAYPFAKRAMKKKLSLSDADGELAFGDEWPVMKAAIEDLDDKKIADFLYGIKDDDKFSNEQKAAMFGYAARLKQYQGANVADMLMRMEGNLGQNEAAIKGAYDEGTDAETPDEMKQFVDEATAAGETLMKYGEQFAAMVANGSADPAKTLDYLMQHRDLYDDGQIAAAADYYHKNARAQGVMDGQLDKVDLEVERANAEVRANTHQGTGQIVMAYSGDEPYYILGGDIVIPDGEPSGTVALVGTGGAVVVKNALTGEVSVKSPTELTFGNWQDAEELIRQNETVLREQLMQQADEDVTYGSPASEVFDQEDTVTLMDGEGGVIEGQIATLPNAVDGVFVVQTSDGRALQMTADELNRRIVQHNGLEVERAANMQLTEPGGEADAEGNEQGGLDNAGGEAGAEEAGANEPPATALSRIPVRTDAKGEPLKTKSGRPVLDWHKASVEDAAAALIETTGGDMLMARDTASDLVKNEQARLEKIRKQKPKGDDPIEIAESRVAIRNQEQEQQAIIKQWQDVNQFIQRQMREEQQRVDAEREAAKSEEQRQREAEEARIRKEQQDEMDRQRLREAIERDRERRNRPYQPIVDARKELTGDQEALAILDDLEPRDLDEWVSSLLSPHSMLWQDASDAEVGLQTELGLKRADMQRFMQLLGTKESGAKPFGKVVLDIYESLPDAMKEQYTDEDVRRVVLDMFREMENSAQMMHLTELHRIDEARQMAAENERRDREAEMEAWAEAYHLTPEERETFEEFMQMPPTDVEEEVINQIIAEAATVLQQSETNSEQNEHEQIRTSPAVGGESDGGGVPAGIEGGEGQVQGTAEGTGDGIYAEGVAEGAEAGGGEPPVSGDEVAGGASADRESVAILLDQIGADVTLAGRMSDYEVEQMNALIEDWEAVNSEYGEVIEQQKAGLQSKNKFDRELAQKVVDEAQSRANEAFEPIEQYVEGLNAKYGIETEEPFEGAIPTPEVDEPRMRAIRQSLADAYRSGDATAIAKAAKAVQDYVDEGLDDYVEYDGSNDNYEGDDPDTLADQYIVHVFQDRYLDDDEDQEYIRTGLKAGMRKIAELSEPDQSDAVSDVSKPQTPDVNGKEPINAETQASSSEGKDTNNISNTQGNLGKTSSAEEILAEEAKVDTNPSEAQKEAGNYQKGHINIDGYDITIENPKGSIRRGVDADGKEWETTMHNTYGYIRGTEGVDGDHIDVFISDAPTSGNVYVVDQVRLGSDGERTFDEHKVMYGFSSGEEAREAYLANYAEGWQGLGAITEVSREDFKKWVQSSHRKTKPFTEYKSVKAAANKQRTEQKAKKEHKRIVSDDQMEELRKKLLEKFNNLNAGIDVERMLLGAMYAVGKIERGVTKFADYAQEMVNEIGDAIRPYLKAFYNAVRDMPEAAPYRDQMDDAQTVEAFDVFNFDKGGKVPNAIVKAEQVVRKQKAGQQVKKIEKEVKQKIQQGDLFAGDLFGDAANMQRTELKAANMQRTEPGAGMKTAWWQDENRPKGLNPKDYKTYTTDEAKAYFAQFKSEDGKTDFTKWAHPELSFITAAVWDGVEIPYEDLRSLPEIVEAEKTIKDAESNGKLEISDEETEQLAQRLLDQGQAKQERKALFIVGLPAGGKSSVFANPLAKQYGARIIDSDDVKPWLDGYDGGNGAGYVQDASAKVAERAIDLAAQNGDNIIIPRIGGSSVYDLAAALRLAGYDVQLYFNDVKGVTSIDRAASRFAQTGRYLSLDYLTKRAGIPSEKFSNFAEKSIGGYLDERTEEEVQNIRGRLQGLRGELYGSGSGLRESLAAQRRGNESTQGAVQDSLGSGELQAGGSEVQVLLSEPLFSYVEWKSNDVPIGEKPKEIWNSKSGKPMPGKKGVNNDARDLQQVGEENRRGSDRVSSGKSSVSRSADDNRLESDLQEGRDERQGDTGVSQSDEAVSGSTTGQLRPVQGLENTLGVPVEGEETRDFSGGPAGRSVGNARVGNTTFHKNRRNNVGERGKDYAPLSPKARFNANVEAIKMMRELTDQGIEAPTKDQMEVLRQYSGWGGLGTFFNDESSAENKILRDLLDEEEYNAATLSIKTAYYTPAYIIDSLWDIAKKLGFKGGNMLEGSAGIGNIIAQMPRDMSRQSDIEAVEIDKISGNILKLLYPDAKVHIQGFQDTVIRNGSVDLAITNVPFAADISVIDKTDKDLSRRFRQLHDFCIAKNIRKLREGGIGIFITSSGTMDKSTDLRAWISDEGQADVVGAFRLNNETFGGTKVTSDIIVVRKRAAGEAAGTSAIDISKATPLRVGTYEDKYGNEHQVSMVVNDYFKEHPEMMAGEMAFAYEKGETYRPGSYGLYPVDGKNQEKMLAQFVKGMEGKAAAAPQHSQQEAEEPVKNQLTAEKEGRMLIDDKGRLCVSERGVAVPLGLNAAKVKGQTKEQCFNDYQAVQKAVDDVLQQQLSSPDDEALKPKLAALNKAYDLFTKRYGTLHKNTAIAFLRNDIDFPSFLALENYSESKDMNGKVTVTTRKAPLFSQRVLGFKTEPQPKTVKDAVVASMFRSNGVDVAWITERLNEVAVVRQHTEQSVREEILKERLGFEDPSTGQLEIRYKYLSGNVREKLAIAEAYNGQDGRYGANIEELRKVVPMDIPAHLIDFSLGSSWIPKEIYTDYLKEVYDLDNAKLTHLEGTWVLDEGYGYRNEKNRAAGVYSEQFRETIYGHQLVLAALNNRPVKVQKQVSEGWGSSKTTRTVTDQAATQACAVRVDEIKDEFKQFAKKKMQDDPELAQRIEKIYNDKFNALVPMEVGDEFLPDVFDGANQTLPLYNHQKRGVMRGVIAPTMLAHEVGTGKSFTLITTAMEMRRLGTAKKPMIVVQNATVAQMTADAKLLYPNAKVLSLSEKDRSAEGRRAFYAKIKYNDWDVVIVPQSTFERIPDSPERELQFIQEKIDEKKHVIEAAEQSGMDSREIQRLKKELEKIEQEYGDTFLDGGRDTSTNSTKGKKKDAKREAASLEKVKVKAQEQLDRAVDDVQYFDDLGVDALLVDEAHEYKHLGFQTSIGRGIKGIDPSYSKKCAGLYNKTRSVFEKAGWKNVVFATGTPISNTAAEIWTFMKYLMPADVMKANDIYYFDDFVHNFGSISQMLEFATSGKFKENTRFAAYVNKPELIRIWSQVADTVLTREVGAVNEKIPDEEGGKDQDVFLPQSPSLIRIMAAVRAELERFENMTGKEKKENSSIPLTMYGIAKRAAIDPRLVDAEAPDEPMSKTNAVVREIVKDLEATKDYKGTVAVFCDNQNRLGSGTAAAQRTVEFNIYDDMKAKLVKAGVPEGQIAIIKSGMSITAKQKVFDAVNSGDIRVVLGSTQTLGTGVNMQERLHLLIHMDAPDRPMDYTQRNGRIKRQGNLHKQWGKSIRVIRFGVEDSLDVTAYQRLKTKSGFIDSIMDGKGALQNNQVDRTVEEEEEGLFDNPVAVLSGSQYALKKNQAERELRKYQGKKAQWEADQVYVANALRRNKSDVEATKERIADEEKQLAHIRSLFPDGKVKSITVEGVKIDMSSGDTAAYGTLAKVVKEKINEPVNATVKKLRENQIYNDEVLPFTVELDGHKVEFKVSVEREAVYENGKMRTVVHKYTTFDSPSLGIDALMKSAKSVGDQLNDILDEVVSGRDNTDRIEAYKARIESINRETEQLQQRVGMAFQYGKELEQARKNVEEYTQLMKQEMKEKEAKYAAQQKEAGEGEASGTGAFDLRKAEENDEDADELYRADEDDDPIYSQAFKDYFGDWESDPEHASKVVDENGRPLIVHHATNLTQVNQSKAFYEFYGGSHFGTEGQAAHLLRGLTGMPSHPDVFLVSHPKKYLTKTYNVYLNIRNPKRVTDVPMDDDEWDGTHAEWWEKQVHIAKKQGYDGLVYLNEYEDRQHPADSWIAFYPEQVKSADENIGTYDSRDPDIRHRMMEMFSEGQLFEIKQRVERSSYNVLGDRLAYWTDLMPDEYSSKQQLLDGLRRQYPGYYVSIEDGQVRFESWAHVLRGSGTAAARPTKATRNYVERRKRNAVNAVNELAQRMGIDDDVEVLMSTEGLKGKKARSKGWFNRDTWKITIVLPNHSNPSDVINTLLHEGVAHYGLRKMFGSNFEVFLDNVYENVEPEIRARIDAAMKRNKWGRHEATEEYLARLAERTEFEAADRQGWWLKIKNFFLEMLSKAGFDTTLTDNELRYILWRSYENLLHPGRYRDVFGVAREIEMQRRLRVGRYARERERLQRTGRIDTSRVAVAEPVREARAQESGNEETLNNNFDGMSSQDLLLSLSQKEGNERNETINELVRRVRAGEAKIIRLGQEVPLDGASDAQIAGTILGGLWQLELSQLADETLRSVVSGRPEVDRRSSAQGKDIASDSKLAVISWAKASGHYYSEEDVKNESLDKDVWQSGAQSRVYRSADGKKVIKFMESYVYYENPLLKNIDGLALQNSVGFEPLTVLGYSLDEFGELQIVLEQDVVEGVTIDEVFYDEGQAKVNDYINKYLENILGLVRHRDAEGQIFHMKDGLIYKDIHGGNVLMDKDGKLHVIDCYMSRADDDKRERADGFSIEDNEQYLYRDDDDIAKDIYEEAVAKDSLKWQEAWQDSMASLKAIQDAIASETGRVATGAEDAYRFENRMHGRAKNMTEQYDWRFYRPMLKAFSDFIKAKGWTQERGMEYLVAKSGLERNVYYAFRDGAKAKVIDEVKQEREQLEKDYAKNRISEADYIARRADLEELERTGADELMENVRSMFAYQHAKDEYDAGNISYSEYLRIVETVIRSQLKRRKPKKDKDGNVVSDNYYDEHATDFSGLTETFAKELYDDAQAVKKDAQRTVDPDERKALWGEYYELMRQAYITARQVAEDAVFSAEDGGAANMQHTELWEKINAATKETLRESYESGLIDKKNYNKVREMFNWYIPLRGWDEDKASDVYTYMGRENVFSPAVKKVWGRQSKAENPLAYIGNIAVSTILSGHRNQMKQHFLNYVMNNPTSLVSISESWYENIAPEGDSPIWILRVADTAGKSADEIAQIVSDFNDEMEQKQREGKAMPVRGRLRLDVHATQRQKSEHVVEVQRAGRTYQLYINGNPKAAQALNGSAARAVSRISDTWLGKKITKINRDMAMFFTSKNPAFVVSNLSRDLNMAGASVAINEGKAYNKRFIQNVIKVLAPRMGEGSRWVAANKQPTGLMPSLMRKWKKGTLDENDETERYFKEFMDEGGETGFVNMLSIDSFKEKMKKEIAQMNGSSLFGRNGVAAKGTKVKETSVHKGLRLLGDTFEFYNRCAEDASRFIVYMTSRQMGKTLEQSIADAKDVTLNFNRKGTGGLGNAEVRDLFIFVNPAIQALANMYRMLKGHRLKFGAVTAAFVAGGALMPIINQWLLNMFGDDDDKQAYWNLPPWVRKNNLVMWIPFTKNFVTIPFAQEFRVFYGVGEMLSSTVMDHPVNKWGLEVFSSVADLVPINPTGNGGNLMVDFAPTMVQPLMQVGENVDFTGKPIWRENQGNKHAPMYTKAYITTPQWMVKLSEGLNDLSGGNEGKKGVIEKYAPFWGDYVNNPAVWNHLLQGYFGGMYNTIAKTFDLGVTAAQGEVPKVYQTPVINRFLNRPVERDNAGALGDDYYSLTEERDALMYELRTWQKKAADEAAAPPQHSEQEPGNSQQAQRHVEEILNSPEFKRAEVVSHYEKIIKDLKAGERAATESADKADIKESIALYKQQMLEELAAIDDGKEPLEAAVDAYSKARTFAEKNKLRMRIERLMMREDSGTAAAQRTKGRNADVEKALRYITDEEKESRDTNEKYLEVATAENVRDDARIKAAKAKLKAINDEHKQMIADGRGDKAAQYYKKHQKELEAWRTIDQLSRAMNANKKLLGKGNDKPILTMIDRQRGWMLKAIEGLKGLQ